MDIMFDDLKEEAQKELLKLYKIESPEEMNWDVMPLDIIEKPTYEKDTDTNS